MKLNLIRGAKILFSVLASRSPSLVVLCLQARAHEDTAYFPKRNFTYLT